MYLLIVSESAGIILGKNFSRVKSEVQLPLEASKLKWGTIKAKYISLLATTKAVVNIAIYLGTI